LLIIVNNSHSFERIDFNKFRQVFSELRVKGLGRYLFSYF